MKNWKKECEFLRYIDYGDRDAPCLLIDGRLIIGTQKDSHSTLVHNMIYGMSPLMDVEAEGEIVDNYEDSGIEWYRYEAGIDESEVLYGNLLKDTIHWEVLDKTISEINQIISKTPKNEIKGFKHCALDKSKGRSYRIQEGL